MPIEGREIFGPQTGSAKGQRHTSCGIQILLRHKPATDIRKSAQPTSTSCPASTNKEPPRHLLKQQSHTSYYTSWSRGHNLQSVHHNSFTKPGHPSAQSAPSYCTPLSCNKQLKQDKLQFNNDNNDNRGSDGGGYW